MTVKELKKALESFDDDSPVVYANTWRSPEYILKGSYLGANTLKTCIFGFSWDKEGNEVIYGNKLQQSTNGME